MGEVAAAAQAARRDRRIDTVVLAKCRRKSQTMWPARLCSKREVSRGGGVRERREGGQKEGYGEPGAECPPLTCGAATVCPMILLHANGANTGRCTIILENLLPS